METQIQFHGNVGIQNTTNLALYAIEEVVEAIKTGKLRGYDFLSTVNEIRLAKTKQETKTNKEKLPYILGSSLVQNGIVIKEPIYHTGHIQLDFDHDSIEDKTECKELSEQFKKKLSQLPFVAFAFISPNNGLKVLCKVPAELRAHDYYLKCLADFFEATYGLRHDPSCIGIKRAMFLSFDPEIFHNPNAIEFIREPELIREEPEVKAEIFNRTDKALLLRQVDQCNAQIEQRRLDFAPEYHIYVWTCFALCSLGEDGRSRFHAACRFSPKYNEQDCDKKFDSCLKDYKGEIKIGTFFHYCKIYGIQFSIANSDTEENEENKLDLLLSETTTLPDHIFENAPEPLLSSSALFPEARVRDLYFLSTIAALSSLFYRVSGLYDNAKVFSNLYSFIIGPPASGKSVVRWSLRCLNGVINHLSSLRMQEEADHAASDGSDADRPIPTALMIPGNSSMAGLIQLLSKNPAALLAETEADAVSKMFDVSFGDFSDKLRAIFHNEPVTSYRKTGREYISIDEPKLSVLVTGTPSQIEPLVKGSTDGLFSRFFYYSFSGRPKYRSPFKNTVSFKSSFDVISEDILEMFKQFKNVDCEFKLTDAQAERFDKTFERWQSQAYNIHKNVGSSIINRMGLILFKIAMVLTILRNKVPSEILVCSDQDFSTALSICEVLRVHSFTVYNVLPKPTNIKPDENRILNEFFKALPSEFKYGVGVALSDTFGISTRQAKRHISALTKKGLLIDGAPKKGYYKKKT